MLWVNGTNDLEWSYDGVDSGFWVVYQSDDGVSGWTVADNIYTPPYVDTAVDDGKFFYVVEADGSFTPTGTPSNIVQTT